MTDLVLSDLIKIHGNDQRLEKLARIFFLQILFHVWVMIQMLSYNNFIKIAFIKISQNRIMSNNTAQC